MKGETLRAAMAGRSPLAGAVLAFNFGLATQVHPDRFPEGAAGEAVRRAMATPRGVRRLSMNLGWVLDGVHPALCFAEFDDPAYRVALTSRDTLNRLVFLFGVAVCRKEIARAVTRDDVLAVRQAVGEEARTFARRRAPFIVSDRDLERIGIEGQGPLTAERVRSHGFRGLAACVQGASQALVARLRLKLPPVADAHLPAGSLTEDVRDAARNVLRRIAGQEAPEEWAAFFN